MLPSRLRFPLRQNSALFFLDPHSVRTAHLKALYQPLPASALQFSIVVRKVHGKAHQRAKTRRQLRALLTTLSATQPQLFAASYAVVVLVQGPPQPFPLYEQELRELLSKLSERFQRSSPEMA